MIKLAIPIELPQLNPNTNNNNPKTRRQSLVIKKNVNGKRSETANPSPIPSSKPTPSTRPTKPKKDHPSLSLMTGIKERKKETPLASKSQSKKKREKEQNAQKRS